MDKLEKYQEIIRQVLQPLTELKYANGDFRNRMVFDEKSHRYLLMSDGWQKDGIRFHGCLIDLEIIDGKIWIQEDNTEEGIATDLERFGVPKSDIVLGFQPPNIRPYTEYAAV